MNNLELTSIAFNLKPLNEQELIDNNGGLVLTGIYTWVGDGISSAKAFLDGVDEGFQKAMIDFNK